MIIAGPGYRSEPVFNLAKMQPYSFMELLYSFHKFTEDIAIFLPRTSDVRQLMSQQTGEGKITAIHYCMEGASKVNHKHTLTDRANRLITLS